MKTFLTGCTEGAAGESRFSCHSQVGGVGVGDESLPSHGAEHCPLRSCAASAYVG